MDIAVIGMAAQFGAAQDVFQYWEHLSKTVHVRGFSPASRWKDAPRVGQGDLQSERVTGNFLPDASRFDFLSLSSVTEEDLQIMGPYAPLLLANTLQAIENAGYTKVTLPRDGCGLFLGYPSGPSQPRPTREIADRLALKGPVGTVDGPAASLSALSDACKKLIDGECALALAGGVDLCIDPQDLERFSETGEGVAVLVLRPLPEAVRHGDYVYGVIQNVEIETSWSHTFSEGHLSRFDRVEISGFTSYPQCNDLLVPCVEDRGGTLSVDTIDESVGTPEATGGLAALVKGLAPSPWNPDRDGGCRLLVASLTGQSSCASVQAERYPTKQWAASPGQAGPYVVVLSAFCAFSFRRLLFRFCDYVERLLQSPEANVLGDLAYSTQVSREALPLRVAFVVNSLEDLQEQLRIRLSGMPAMFEALVEDRSYLKRTFGNDYDDEPFRLSVSIGKITSLQNNASEIADLWCAGADIRWEEFYTERGGGRRVPIPGRGSFKTPIPFHSLLRDSPRRSPANGSKPRPIVFVLSAPASGSTLLQSMLRCNEELFAPGELNWMGTDSILDHERIWKRIFPIFAGGLPIALQTYCTKANIQNCQHFIALLKQQDIRTGDLYKLMQERLEGLSVVDKSPFYTASPGILGRIERICDDPLYIFLHRHPLSNMQSLTMEGRAINRMLDHLHSPSPWKNACDLWFRSNQNVLRHLSSIPGERKMVVSYEKLVTEPGETMETICRFLNVRFDRRMSDPYSAGQIDGGGSGAWAWHNDIDPSMAEKWRKYREYSRFISEPAKRLARTLGYHEGL